MRRKDREMDYDFGLYVIDKAEFGSLAVYSKNLGLENLPLSIVRNEDTIYFHSAKLGNKVEIFKENPLVVVSFVVDTKIPENYSKEELEEFKSDKSKAKDLISKVFTTEFASALVYGQVNLVEARDEQIMVLRKICEKYTPSKMEYFPLAIEAGLSRVNIYKIKIDKLSSKRKKYDLDGLEMKYMRF